jgi:hypothetical protein
MPHHGTDVRCQGCAMISTIEPDPIGGGWFLVTRDQGRIVRIREFRSRRQAVLALSEITPCLS